ncbi:MAG: transposase [Candidatus Contendobacter sp.]|nr:transposase [Candidatus Contendobacter sp.]
MESPSHFTLTLTTKQIKEDSMHLNDTCPRSTPQEPSKNQKNYRQPWAVTMADLLLEIKKTVEAAQENGAERLSSEVLTQFEQRYDQVIAMGYLVNPRPPSLLATGKKPKKRGRPAQTPPLNLLDRLRDFKPQTLAFMTDFRVAFDNNQAEQDVRMVKVGVVSENGKNRTLSRLQRP